LPSSSAADAFGLERAARAGVPTAVVERKPCASREEFSQRSFAQVCRAWLRTVGWADRREGRDQRRRLRTG